MSQLNELLQQLGRARQAEEAAKALRANILETVKQSHEYIDADASVKQLGESISELTEQIRDLAEAQYAADGNKKPHPAYEIKINKVTNIKDKEALKGWCLHNFTPALVVDEKQVATAAKAGNIPAELVEVTDEPKVYFATDLTKYEADNVTAS